MIDAPTRRPSQRLVAHLPHMRLSRLLVLSCLFVVVEGCSAQRPQAPKSPSKLSDHIKITRLQFDERDTPAGALAKQLGEKLKIVGEVKLTDGIRPATVLGVVCEWRVRASSKSGYAVTPSEPLELAGRNLKDTATAGTLQFQGVTNVPAKAGQYELCCGVFHTVPGTFDYATSVFYREIVEVK